MNGTKFQIVDSCAKKAEWNEELQLRPEELEPTKERWEENKNYRKHHQKWA